MDTEITRFLEAGPYEAHRILEKLVSGGLVYVHEGRYRGRSEDWADLLDRRPMFRAAEAKSSEDVSEIAEVLVRKAMRRCEGRVSHRGHAAAEFGLSPGPA